MTAPLPPLPEWTQVWLNEYQKASLRDHAKLAVRNALEGALLAVMDYHDRDTIRAMIEEYK